jgi:lipopolysaccharide export system protein LptC
MAVELHIPDLPEVPISLGPAPGPARPPGTQARPPWHLRLRDTLSSYLPLLLMALLALASWWLVANSPRPLAPAQERVVSSEPDYTMSVFALERFDPAGRLKLRIEGATLRHFPATDQFEIDDARIRYIAPDGRVTLAVAKKALGNGDGSEVQLRGEARVTAQDEAGGPVLMRSEFLQAYLVTERVRSHLPVVVQARGITLNADGLEYDHPSGKLDLKGPVRAEAPPKGAGTPKAAKAGEGSKVVRQ